jgi:hypothetical protein
MPLAKQIRQEIERVLASYCDKRVPLEVRSEVRVGFHIRGNSVTLFEERPHWQDQSRLIQALVAQFRYDPKNSRWNLFCADRYSRWQKYPGVKPSKSIDTVIGEVDRDPMGIFWG